MRMQVGCEMHPGYTSRVIPRINGDDLIIVERFVVTISLAFLPGRGSGSSTKHRIRIQLGEVLTQVKLVSGHFPGP